MESLLHKEGSEDRTVMGRMCVVGGGWRGGGVQQMKIQRR